MFSWRAAVLDSKYKAHMFLVSSYRLVYWKVTKIYVTVRLPDVKVYYGTFNRHWCKVCLMIILKIYTYVRICHLSIKTAG